MSDPRIDQLLDEAVELEALGYDETAWECLDLALRIQEFRQRAARGFRTEGQVNAWSTTIQPSNAYL